uniref:Phospholipid carrier-dependent glycosyltransferase n=1 Tax=candidate division WOR-3 bacterium TaxID=2052148 RepID=A0A7C6EBU9_UNCW3
MAIKSKNSQLSAKLLQSVIGGCGLPLAIGLIVRLIGINFGLPYATGARPDELVIIRHTLPFGTGDLNPHFFHYPSFFLYFSFLIFGIYFLFGLLLGRYHSPTDFAASVLLDPSPLILIIRLISVFFGTLTVYFIYLLFRDKDKTTGIIASILLSSTYLAVRESHFGTTDTAMVFFGLLAFLFAWRVKDLGKTKDYIISGILAGIAASTKYNGAIFLLTLIVAFLLRLKTDHWRKIALGITSALIAFLFFSPFILFDFSTFITQFREETAHLLSGATIELGRGWLNFITIGLRYGIGLPLLIFSLIAIIWTLLRNFRFAIFLLSFPLVYYLLIGASRAVYVRHILPIVPFLCIFACLFVKQLTYRFKGAIRPIILTLTLFILLSSSIQNIIGYLTTITKKDTRSCAAEWIIKNLPPNSTIGWVGSAWSVPNLPLSTSEISARFNEARIGIALPAKIIEAMKTKVGDTGYRIVRFSKELANNDTLRFFNIDQIKKRNIQYLVVTSYPGLPFGEVPEEIIALQKDTANYKLQIQFNPFKKSKIGLGGLILDKQDATYLPFANFSGVQRPGPLISIYQIRTDCRPQ